MTPPLAGLRRLLARLALATVALLALASLAEAHRLKVFVTVAEGEISGYAFFIGGGRPEGVDVVVKDATGAVVHRGTTDDHGAFRWRPPVAADYTVTVDAGDGHWIDATVTADRLGAVAMPPPAEIMPRPPAADAAPGPGSTAPTVACPPPIDPAALARVVETRVDEAVARQLRPLIEAATRAEGRLRLNDVMGGVGMIVGLAGAALWASARRRRDPEAS